MAYDEKGSSPSSVVALRVTGLGHSLTLSLSTTSSICDLKRAIEEQTALPCVYQKLLAWGSKLDDDNATLEDAGLKDRTRIMLIHNSLYAEEKEGFESLVVFERELEEVLAKKDTISEAAISELATRICCKLDEVDIKGSEYLRAKRKELLRKAELH